MRKFELFSALSKDEFARFSDFTASPFFNKRNDLVILVNFLKNHYPHFDLSDEDIYRSVHGDDKFNLQVARNLVSRLRELLVKFLTQLGVEKQETFRNISLAYELARKGKTEQVNRTLSEGMDELKNETYSVEYLKKYYEYLELNEELIVDNKDYKTKLEHSFKRGECAVNYYLLNLLRIANDHTVFKHVHRYQDKAELFNGFLDHFDFKSYLQNLKESGSEYYAITAIFYYGLLSKLDDPRSTNRQMLKYVIFENLEKLKLKDQYTCWLMLFASYIFTNNVQSRTGINQEMHEINMVFVEKNLVPRDDLGYVMENNYHNIAMQAILSKDFEWAENFLNEYKEHLNPAKRESAHFISMAACLLGKKEYERCVEFLSKVPVTDIMAKITIRTTYIKCYYELGYFDEAESAIEAMRIFTYQNKELTPQIKRSLPDFLKYSKLLLKIKSKGVKFPDEHFLKARKTTGFNSRTWVLEKMEELM